MSGYSAYVEKKTYMSYPGGLLIKPHPKNGVIIKNIGGRLGWWSRRFFPSLSTGAYLWYIRTTRSRIIRKHFAAYAAKRRPEWFTHVEIETINRCNGSCSFCPVNHKDDPRPYSRMSDSLYSHIVQQLAEIQYSGYVGLFSNNEPLLDKRIHPFAEHIRQALPRAFLNLSTNGNLLDVDSFIKLIKSFDRIVVNNYRSTPEMHTHIKELYNFCQTAEGKASLRGKTLEISLRNSDDILTSRAGNAPNRPPIKQPLGIPCWLPFSQLVIRPDGGVSLCCNDALGQMTLGRLDSERLYDVWFGPVYGQVRQTMIHEGRHGLPLCQKCDFVKHDLH